VLLAVYVQGSGFEASTQTAVCRVCRGSGEIMVRHWSHDGSSSNADGTGWLTLPRSCPACKGTGKSEQQECKR
jgi:DnaJ-class molecular chaperone